MKTKTTLFVACLMATIVIKAQPASSADSLVGFNYKELQHHLADFKGTETQRSKYIAGVKRRFINKKYNLGTYTNRNGNSTTQALDCTNIGFESGDTTGWAITGDYKITSGTGVDTFGSYPVVYPSGGNYSLRLSSNYTTTTNFQSTATRAIAVTSANAYLNLHYAIDILDYPHTQSAAAKFSIDFYDASGTLLTCPQLDCYYYQNSASLGINVGFTNPQQTTCPGNCGVNLGGQSFPVVYQTWQTIVADLTPYIGTYVTCKITCDWCIYNYDWAYCYVDADCSSTNPSQITQSNNLCTGGSTILSGPAGMASYSWAGPVTGTTQNLVTSTAGSYTLTSTSATGCSAPTLYYTLTQGSGTPPPVSVVASKDSICSGATTILTASGANTYTWSNNSATTNSITVSPTSNTTYTVTGIDTTSGCASTATHSIEILNTNVSIQATNNPLCSGTTATLTASGASTYTWSTNAGSLTTNTVAVSPTVNTTYTVTGTDTVHSCISSTTEVVYMARNTAIQNPSSTICEGTSVTLTASGASSYTWSTGATTNSIIVTPTVTTSYTVTGSVTCVNTSTTTINVNAVPNLQVTASTTTLCAGNTATLSASGANTYSWSTSATTASIMVTPTVTTIYTVTGTATSTNCKSTDTLSINVVNCSTGINLLAGGIEQISIYPNPTKDEINLTISQFDNLRMYNIEVYNIIGECVHRQIIKSSNCQIDVSTLSEGVYFLTIKTANNTITKKVIVQR